MKDREVNLFVPPIYLKQRLESASKVWNFRESPINDTTHHILLISVVLILVDPWEGIQVLFIMLFPDISYYIIPFF